MVPLIFIFAAVGYFIFKMKASEVPKKNFMAEGIALGLCLGTAFSVAMDVNIGIGAGLGLFFGMMIGMMRRGKEDE